MAIMALRELGFRNNGISSARKAIVMRFGSYSNPMAKKAIRQAATHAVLYDNFLASANGWFSHGFEPIVPAYLIAHLTGGGLKSKFVEDILLPRGFSARLDNLWPPPVIMRQCAKWRGMDDEECYETWHGGQGALVVIDESRVRDFIALARRFGIQARRAGEIVRRKRPSVTIKSKFTGKTISWFAR